MKIVNTKSNPVYMSGLDGDTTAMSINEANTNKALSMFADGIYSDKIMAVVREYTCNALDEHDKHGIDRSVDVGIKLENGDFVFSVRDYALGLDDDGMKKVFSQFFESTKSGSNSAIGGFGVGSKAGHAYTDTFFVRSMHDGVETLYSCIKDVDSYGFTKGVMKNIYSKPTSETGIEVFMNISNDATHLFDIKIKEMVLYSKRNIVYRNDDYKTTTTPLDVYDVLECENGAEVRFYKKTTDRYFDFSYYSTFNFAMGGVIYEKRSYCMRSDRYSQRVGICSDYVCVIDFPIGDLTIPITRESFDETPANIKKMDDIVIDLCAYQDQQNLLLTEPTLKEILDLSVDGVNYKKITNTFNKTVFKHTFKIEKFIKAMYLSTKHGSIQKNDNDEPLVIIIPDTRLSSMWMGRAESYCEKNGIGAYITKSEHVLPDYGNYKRIQNLDWGKVKTERKFKFIYNNHTYMYNGDDVMSKVFGHIDMSMSEASIKKAMKKFYDGITSMSDYNKYVFSFNSIYNTVYGSFNTVITAKTFKKELEKYGVLFDESVDANDLKSRIVKGEREKRLIQDTKNRAIGAGAKHILNKNTIRLVTNDVKYAEKLNRFWDFIDTSDKTSHKILRMEVNSSYGMMGLTRKEIRNILNTL